MIVRIVVANEGEARFYDASRHDAPLTEGGHLENPSARLHDRDLKSDRPGRVFHSALSSAGRRGAVAHHGVGGESGPRRHEAGLFAKRVVEELEMARREGRFERLVLIAAPAFLGHLREALPKSLRTSLAAEVDKDLVRQPEEAIQAHLPPAAFRQQP
jgi:protein required for attachment to host cells